MALTHRLP